MPSTQQNAARASDSELVGKLRQLTLHGPGQALQGRARQAYLGAAQPRGGREEVSVNELACYLEETLTLPRPLSYMASLMYT